MNTKHLVTSLCLSSILAGSLYAFPVQADQVCLRSSIENMNLEINLIDQINRIKLNSEIQVQEIDRIEREMSAYSDNIDQASEVIQKIAGWDRTIAGILNTIITDYVDIPGIEIDIEQTEGRLISLSPAGALIDLSGLLDTFTPSNIADWITETSLSLSESRLAITSSSAEASLLLSRQLRQLRARCEEEQLEQSRLQEDASTLDQESEPEESNSNDDDIPIEEQTPIEQVDPQVELDENPSTAPALALLGSDVWVSGVSVFSGDNHELIGRIANELSSSSNRNSSICLASGELNETAVEDISEFMRRNNISPESMDLQAPFSVLYVMFAQPSNQISSFVEPFGGYLTNGRITHDDNLQTFYDFDLYIPDSNADSISTVGSVNFTFFKDSFAYDSQRDSSHLRDMFERSVGYFPGVNFSTSRCNF